MGNSSFDTSIVHADRSGRSLFNLQFSTYTTIETRLSYISKVPIFVTEVDKVEVRLSGMD